MRVSWKEWPVPQLIGVYGIVRVPRNLDSLFYNCPVLDLFFSDLYFSRWGWGWVHTGSLESMLRAMSRVNVPAQMQSERCRDSMNYLARVHAPHPFTDHECTCFVSPIRDRLWSPRNSLIIIWMAEVLGFRHVQMYATDSFSASECNRDFVAPALRYIPLWAAWLITPFVTPTLCHIPIEVVSVTGWEHLH